MDDQQRQHKPGASPPRPAAEEAPASLDPRLQAHIGQQLRSMYDDVLNQAVPDRFMELLSRLDAPADAEPPGGGAA